MERVKYKWKLTNKSLPGWTDVPGKERINQRSNQEAYGKSREAAKIHWSGGNLISGSLQDNYYSGTL